MAKLADIVSYLSESLRISEFPDSSLNGLQLEGSVEVDTVGLAVDAGASVIADAISKQVDLLIVHHGIFWSKPLAIVGSLKKTFEQAINSGLSIFAAHLPLDAHKDWGNNFTLARFLELSELQTSFPYNGVNIGCKGQNVKRTSLQEMSEKLKKLPGFSGECKVLPFGSSIPQSVGIVTGSGADALYSMKALGVDTLISGEGKQFAYHFAKDNGLNAIFAGHYATETVGVIETGKALENKFGIKTIFIDQPTGF